MKCMLLALVFLIIGLSSAAFSSPIDPTVTILGGGHSTDVFGTSYGPFFPFSETAPLADCNVGSTLYPDAGPDAFCTFNNSNTEGLTFNTIALTITGETFSGDNILGCDNVINPEAGCEVSGNTVTFFGLGIPSSFVSPAALALLVADPSSEWTFEFEKTFDHSIGASFLASPTDTIPEPASALLVMGGLAGLAIVKRFRTRTQSPD